MRFLDETPTELLESIVTILVGALLVLFVVILPLDAMDFYKYPEDYIRVHHLDTSKSNWELQYLGRSIFILLWAVSALTIMMLSIRFRSTRIRAIRRVMVALTLFIVLFGFYEWAETGFDH